ncbi:MAG: Uncharacterized protein CEO12_401 [Parcubacteria group bacterium Gr01-1014_46]|nr:MAG: Uncharacterized protein CEO12_401 [Parcubacteria group bacterium Gr01-1014_46]
MTKFKINSKKGFTLIEIMVSVSIFSVIMLMVSSSIYTVFDANRKSQSLRSVMDNLNLSLESMTRTIRFGKDYHCDINSGSPSSPQNCSNGADSIAVTNSSGNTITFRLSNGRIIRNDGSDAFVTGSDITIDTLTFRVFGAIPYSSGSDLLQPKVVIVIEGHAGIKATVKSSFILQTTVSQRQFDSQ